MKKTLSILLFLIDICVFLTTKIKSANQSLCEMKLKYSFTNKIKSINKMLTFKVTFFTRVICRTKSKYIQIKKSVLISKETNTKQFAGLDYPCFSIAEKMLKRNFFVKTKKEFHCKIEMHARTSFDSKFANESN